MGQSVIFRGASLCKVDAKGRFAVPVKYRDSLIMQPDRGCVITIDTIDHCLLLYPHQVWQVMEEKLQALSSFDPEVRRVQRLLIGHANECELDSHGRLLLPSLLRQHAAIEQSLVLVGQGKRFELWNEDQWQQKTQDWLQACRESCDRSDAVSGALTEISL